MHPNQIWISGGALLTWASLFTVSLAGEDVVTPLPPSSPQIKWTRPSDGLMIGIEQPTNTFHFTLRKGFDGRVIFTNRVDSHGRAVGISATSAGEWDKNATLRVHLKNLRKNDIVWTRSWGAWRVSFSGSGFRPVQWPSHAPPMSGSPPDPWPQLRLKAGATETHEIPISQACRLWPEIKDGMYRVTVTYSPRRFLGYGERSEELKKDMYPWKIPEFWTGSLTTPEIEVNVKQLR